MARIPGDIEVLSWLKIATLKTSHPLTAAQMPARRLRLTSTPRLLAVGGVGHFYYSPIQTICDAQLINDFSFCQDARNLWRVKVESSVPSDGCNLMDGCLLFLKMPCSRP